jgi:pyruvate formate lyase activating enzyme
LKQKLEVMEIQKFSVHDGDGIRTTVFLKGCPLRCPWCANPESQSLKKQVMYTESKCISCLKCVEACRYKAILAVEGKPVFYRSNCAGCGECERICPADAIQLSGKTMTIEEILKVVLKDKDYYDATGGGITVSGGEPFIQFEGFLALLKACKERELNTAVETAGQVPGDHMAEAEPYIDHFLYDIKHIEAQALRETTKGNLSEIYGNLKFLAELNPNKITIRVPVIPGFNMKEKVINHIYDWALELKIKKISLLPYHTLGKHKYIKLGMVYPMQEERMLEKSELIMFQKAGIGKNLIVTVSE